MSSCPFDLSFLDDITDEDLERQYPLDIVSVIHETDDVYRGVKHLEPKPGIAMFAAHSNGKIFYSLEFSGKDIKSFEKYTVEEAVDMLFENNKEPFSEIVLLSCGAGFYGVESAAQEFADLTQMLVWATKGTIWVLKNGNGFYVNDFEIRTRRGNEDILSKETQSRRWIPFLPITY